MKFSSAYSAAYIPKNKQHRRFPCLGDGETYGARIQSWSTTIRFATAAMISRNFATPP
ncbi:hypothetical protein LINPERPRIM_LOCUS13873 [Linum perenne]